MLVIFVGRTARNAFFKVAETRMGVDEDNYM